MLTQSRLKELLHYDPETGVFTWKVWRGNQVRVGSVAGHVVRGYIAIGIDGRDYAAHRIAWLYSYGALPPADLDHINHQTADNRIANLRPATRSENNKNRLIQSNNTSGFRGVCWKKQSGKWLARAKLNGKTCWLGYFPTAEAASEAYEAFARQHHGEFYNENGA